MLADNEFKFTLNVSVGDYPTAKPKNFGALVYHTQELTLNQLGELQQAGKAFCYNFEDKYGEGLITQSQKTLKGFDYTNIIFFDIDKMPTQMADYTSPLPFKPSLSYTTISNGKDGKYGYRLLYAFWEPMTSIEEFDTYYYAIAAANGFKQQIYPDGTKYEFDYRKVNQQYYGGGTNSETLITNIIYSKSDFTSFIEEGTILKETIGKQKNKKSKATQSLKETEIFPNENIIGKAVKEKAYYSQMENPFYQDLFTLPPKDFIEKHQELYDTYEASLCSPCQLSDDGRYWIYPENYQEVKRKWSKDEDGKRCVRKWKIGSGRKKRLYVTAQIMRFNVPDITKEQLVFNLVYERFFYYQNSDNNLNNKVLIQIADSALSHYFTLSPCKHPKFSVNKECLKGNMTTNAVKNVIRKELKEEQVLSLYDFNLSVKENLQILKDNGIKVSKSYLYALKKRYDSSDDFPNEIIIGEEQQEKAYCSQMEKSFFSTDDFGNLTGEEFYSVPNLQGRVKQPFLS